MTVYISKIVCPFTGNGLKLFSLFCRPSFKSIGLTVLRSTENFLLSHLFTPTRVLSVFKIKTPTLQNYKVSKYKFAPALALKWYPSGFLVWAARRDVLQRAVCHLAARIDKNRNYDHHDTVPHKTSKVCQSCQVLPQRFLFLFLLGINSIICRNILEIITQAKEHLLKLD